MFNKLEFVLDKYDELSMKVSDPEIINNQPLWQKHIKEMGGKEVFISGQVQVVGFYVKKLGYTQYGDVYLEENKPHVALKKAI